jgi:hypothetical protein
MVYDESPVRAGLEPAHAHDVRESRTQSQNVRSEKAAVHLTTSSILVRELVNGYILNAADARQDVQIKNIEM